MSGQSFPGVARLARRTLIRRLVLLGVLIAALVVFAVLWPRPAPGGLAVPTVTGSVEVTGVLSGPLVAERHGRTVCYSVTARGMTAVLRFVPGWSANDRLGLVDPAGSVVAQPGSTVLLTGAPGGLGVADGCTARGRLWTITAARFPPPT